jgi:type VI secretion system protein ImpH
MLRDYYEMPVEAEQFSGRWVRLGVENETHVGVQNTEVGVNMICGARIWDRQSKFRLRFGPLDLNKFRSFLPSGDAWQSMNQLVRLFAGNEYDFDVQLVLKAGEVPPCELRTDVKEGPRLGWSSWLKTKEFTRDAHEPILASGN